MCLCCTAPPMSLPLAGSLSKKSLLILDLNVFSIFGTQTSWWTLYRGGWISVRAARVVLWLVNGTAASRRSGLSSSSRRAEVSQLV